MSQKTINTTWNTKKDMEALLIPLKLINLTPRPFTSEWVFVRTTIKLALIKKCDAAQSLRHTEGRIKSPLFQLQCAVPNTVLTINEQMFNPKVPLCSPQLLKCILTQHYPNITVSMPALGSLLFVFGVNSVLLFQSVISAFYHSGSKIW